MHVCLLDTKLFVWFSTPAPKASYCKTPSLSKKMIPFFWTAQPFSTRTNYEGYPVHLTDRSPVYTMIYMRFVTADLIMSTSCETQTTCRPTVWPIRVTAKVLRFWAYVGAKSGMWKKKYLKGREANERDQWLRKKNAFQNLIVI